jgi:hypothetical protein
MSIEQLINEAREEYKRHEMFEPYLLDGTSERHARNALDYLCSRRWNEALSEARIAAQQRSRWDRFASIVGKACDLGGS